MIALEPLRPTTARWLNARKVTRGPDGEPREKWKKILAHKGHYVDLFAYGTDTPTDWPGSGFQKCLIGAEHVRAMYADVDSWSRLSVTPLGQALIARGLPISRRGPEHCHWALDGRGVPAGRWPAQAVLYGDKDIGHLKSHGFVPVPGSIHWSQERYEPVYDAQGRCRSIWVDEELLGLLEHAVSFDDINGGSGGGGGRHGNGEPIDAEKVIAQGVSEGMRNDTLYKLACSRYRRHGTDDNGDDLVLAELHKTWLAGDTGDFDWEEVLALAVSARRFIEGEQAREHQEWQRWGPGFFRRTRVPGQRKRRQPGRSS